MKPTPRQFEIICLRCDEGLTRRQCADRMCISEDAVKEHIRKALRRTRLRSMMQLCTAHGRATMLRDLGI